MEVDSFKFSDFMSESEFRLVVQCQKVKPKENIQDFFGKRYIYCAILTNDYNMSEEVIHFYNARGTSERNFDVQNNDFGWAHLPFSFMKEKYRVHVAYCNNQEFLSLLGCVVG